MVEKPERIRAFVAIHPPAPVIERVLKLMRELQMELGPGLRWVREEQLHLTTQFLGWIRCEQLEALQSAIADVARLSRSFSLRAKSLGCFPSAQRARVLWVGLDGQTTELQALKLSLDISLAAVGYVPEERPFHPHLTLGRISELAPNKRALLKNKVAELESFSAGDFQVESVDLMRSVLSPQGATYSLIRSFSLQPVPATRE